MRYQIEVTFWDEVDQKWDGTWAATDKTYKSLASAERARERLEIRNAANGADCKTRIVSYPVTQWSKP
jgi:hypothetical protein